MKKQSPEPIILAVVLVLLILTAAGLAFTFPSPEDITQVSSTSPEGHQPIPVKADALQAQFSAWAQLATWTAPANQHRLFVSSEFLFYASEYPDGKYIVKFDPSARTPSGVLISWYRKYGIDFTNPNVDREDPDHDGFSNITEFKNEVKNAADADGSQSTNPLDPLSHPSYLSRIRLQKYDSRPFHIQFRGYQTLEGIDQYQIYLKDEPDTNQPRLKKTGDPLGFEGYTVGVFHKNIVTKEDPATHIAAQVDESTLELDKPEINFKIVLPFRQEVDSPESTANFVMLMPSLRDTVIKVPRGKIFTPPFMKNTKFLVIEANGQGAVVEDLQKKQNIKIPLLNPKEWDEVPLQ